MFVEKEEAAPASGVVSLIGLAGAWVGSGSLSCSADFACKIASQLLMTEYTADHEDVLDAVAEVTNMIIGNVKTALEKPPGSDGAEHAHGDLWPQFSDAQRAAIRNGPWCRSSSDERPDVRAGVHRSQPGCGQEDHAPGLSGSARAECVGRTAGIGR